MKNQQEVKSEVEPNILAEQLREMQDVIELLEEQLNEVDEQQKAAPPPSRVPTLKRLVAEKIPYLCPMPPIENLVFSGGGVRGVVFPGVVEALENRDVLKSVKRVAGTSAGAIIAMLVSLGFSAEQIHEDSDNTNFAKFMDRDDASFWDAIGLSIVSKAFDLLNEQKKGIYKGDVIHAWIQLKVYEATGNPRATFADVHKLRELNPNVKDLFLTGTDIISHALWEFSWETTPDVAIADAVRASMSFPGAFENIFIDVGGLRRPFVDGGVIAQYPMHLFDDTSKLNPEYKTNDAGANPCTLGIRVDCQEELDTLLWTKHPQFIDDPEVLEHLDALQEEQPEPVREILENIKEEIIQEKVKSKTTSDSTTEENTLSEIDEPPSVEDDKFEAPPELKGEPEENVLDKIRQQMKSAKMSQERPRLKFTEYIKSIIQTMYSNHPEVWTRYSTNSVQVFDEDHDTLDFSINQSKKDRMYKSGLDCTSEWFKLYRSPKAYYYLEDESESKRLEMRLKPNPASLKKLLEEMLFKREVYILEGKEAFSIEMLAVNRRIRDIRNHPLVKVEEPSELGVQVRLEDYKQKKKEQAAFAVKYKDAHERRFNIMQFLRGQNVSQGLEELLTIHPDLYTIELYQAVFPQELYNAIVKDQNHLGHNLFVVAAANNQLDVIKRLIKLEKDLKQKPKLIHLTSNNEEYPIYAAAKHGHVETVKFLLEQGAKLDDSGPSAKEHHKDNAVVAAARHKQTHLVIEMLHMYGGSKGKFFNLKATDVSGMGILHYVLAHGCDYAVEEYFRLVKRHYDGYIKDYIDFSDSAGVRPIHIMAQYGRVEMFKKAKEIFSAQYNFSSRTIGDVMSLDEGDFLGKTPLEYAVRFGHPEMVECFLDAGATCPKEATREDLIEKAKENQRIPKHKLMRSKSMDMLPPINKFSSSPQKVDRSFPKHSKSQGAIVMKGRSTRNSY